jgi:hypothetical protein
MAGSFLPDRLHRMNTHRFISKSNDSIAKCHDSVGMTRETDDIRHFISHSILFCRNNQGSGHESTEYWDGSVRAGIGNIVFCGKPCPDPELLDITVSIWSFMVFRIERRMRDLAPYPAMNLFLVRVRGTPTGVITIAAH